MDLIEYIKFPLQDADWVKKILFGCIIFLVPVLNIIIIGYYIQCIQLGFERKQILPEWDNWPDIIRDGLVGLVILVIYLLIPLILASFLGSIPVLGIFLASILFICIGALIPIAITHYAFQRDFKDAFRIISVIDTVNQVGRDYLAAYILIVFAVAFGLAIIIVMPYLAILGILLLFYSGIVFSNYIGRLTYSSP